jgi:phosphatidylcholine synthase
VIALAWLVHLYTASSAAFGVWAVVEAFEQRFERALGLMLLTLVIDSTDGALARSVDVRRRIPWFDGRRLDDICDYFTYVAVPACFMIAADLLPHPAWAALPVLASCYGFSRDDAKTPDHFFTGFPSYWNVVATYMYLLAWSPTTCAAVLALLSAGVFVPMRWIYPSRTRPLRPLTVAVLGLWVLGLAWLLGQPQPEPQLVYASLFGPAYYAGLSLALELRSRPRAGNPAWGFSDPPLADDPSQSVECADPAAGPRQGRAGR